MLVSKGPPAIRDQTHVFLSDNSLIPKTSTYFLNFADMDFKLIEPVISLSGCRSFLHYTVTISVKYCHLLEKEINLLSILFDSSTNQKPLKISLFNFLFFSEIHFYNHIFFLWRGLYLHLWGLGCFVHLDFHLCVSSYWSRSDAEPCRQIDWLESLVLSLVFSFIFPAFCSSPVPF